MVKNKLLLGCSLVALVFVLVACNDFALPNSVRVQGEPGLYLPLGSPFSKKKLVKDFIDIDEELDKIRDAGKDELGKNKQVGIVKYQHPEILLGGDKFKDESDKKKFTVDGIKDVQTYLIHYPISELPVDLTSYMADSMEDMGVEDFNVDNATKKMTALSNLPGMSDMPIYLGKDGENIKFYQTTIDPSTLGSFSSLYPSDLNYIRPENEANIPSIASINLKDDTELGKWMKDIVVKSGSGIKIESDVPEVNLAGKVEMKIPALGITEFQPVVPGDGEHAGDFVILSDPVGYPSSYHATTLLPKGTPHRPDSFDDIEIYVKLVNPDIKGNLAITLVFEWEKATVSPGDNGENSGSFTVPVSGITDYLGGNKFASVPAYIYLSGFGDIGYDTTEITMKLKTGDENPKIGDHWFYGDKDSGEGENVEFMPFTLYDKFNSGDNVGIKTINDEIPDPSNTEYILQMKDLLNASEEMPLYYNVQVKELDVSPDESEFTITIDLLLVLPLYFDVEPQPEKWPEGEDSKVGNYIKLYLEDLEDFNDDFTDDLLDGGYRDSIDLTQITMYLNITNDITDDLYIGIDPKRNGSWKVFPLETTGKGKSTQIPFKGNEIDPFTPQFVALVKEGAANSGHGPLKIKPLIDSKPKPDDNSGFNVSITVEASAALDMTIDF